MYLSGICLCSLVQSGRCLLLSNMSSVTSASKSGQLHGLHSQLPTKANFEYKTLISKTVLGLVPSLQPLL